MKNLFSKSLRKKKLAVATASVIVFVAASGFTFYETTKKTVTLNHNGQKEVIRTHAATIQDLFDELGISLRSEDYLFPSADTVITDQLEIRWKQAKQVHILAEGKKKSVWTTANNVDELLKTENIVIREYDRVAPGLDVKIENDLDIKIEFAFPLTLVDGGQEKQVWSTSTTVGDFLKQQGITLGELDRVKPELTETVGKDAVINVIRVQKVTDVVEEPISYAVVTQKDNTMMQGTEKVVTSGKEGRVSKEFEVILENGIEISRNLVNETKLSDKQDQVVAVGTKVHAAGGRELYVSSTAYTASCNGCSGITATGIDLHANPNMKVIAVDPSLIPLGTKVYVEGYGYAIAADTGSSIKGKKIDVFFSSKADAYRWGRKTVKIRILNE
ncbi:DUF348 domain-containing protein [Bacillaceae bacterium Marseille-Q3522]|nr:DUF348 domain-containing protein [Bacillaceae bacterium Marseille-Q3522]